MGSGTTALKAANNHDSSDSLYGYSTYVASNYLSLSS